MPILTTDIGDPTGACWRKPEPREYDFAALKNVTARSCLLPKPNMKRSWQKGKRNMHMEAYLSFISRGNKRLTDSFVSDTLESGRFIRSEERFQFAYGFKHGTVFRRRHDWQGDDEGRSLTRFAFHSDIALMKRYDLLNNGESHAVALILIVPNERMRFLPRHDELGSREVEPYLAQAMGPVFFAHFTRVHFCTNRAP